VVAEEDEQGKTMPDVMNRARPPLRFKALLAAIVVLTLLSGWYYNTKKRIALTAQLVVAVKKNDTAAALQLLSQGADPDARDAPERPLSFWQLIKHALHRDGSDANYNIYLTARTVLETALDADHANVALAKALLEAGAHADDSSKYGVTPLMTAVSLDQLDRVQMLLEHGANPLAKDNNGQLPIHHIANNLGSQLEIVELLFKGGADVNAADNEGRTPLINSVTYGDVGVMRLLLAHGASVNAKSKEGVTALLTAVSTNDADAVQLLLEHGADVNASDASKRTPLCDAALNTQPEIVKQLLEHGAKVDPIDMNGDTPLTASLENGDNPDVIRVLLAHHADVRHRNKNDQTALSIAEKGNYGESIILLKVAGAGR